MVMHYCLNQVTVLIYMVEELVPLGHKRQLVEDITLIFFSSRVCNLLLQELMGIWHLSFVTQVNCGNQGYYYATCLTKEDARDGN
jgi:hypothetical protein